MLQPLRKEKPAASQPEPSLPKPVTTKPPTVKVEATTSKSVRYNVKSTTIIKKTQTTASSQKSNTLNQTIILDKKIKEDKENKKQLGLSIEPTPVLPKTPINLSNSSNVKTDMINYQSLYDKAEEEDIQLDATPKLSDFQASSTASNINSVKKVQLTPKLSDFLKPSNVYYENDYLNSSITSLTSSVMHSANSTMTTTTTTTKLTTIASTKLIDISIDQENPLNNKTMISYLQPSGLDKTPYLSEYKSSVYLNDSIVHYAENETSMNYFDLEKPKIPRMNKDFLYIDLETYVVMCQKAWRMKKFRRSLKQLKLKAKNERLSLLLANSKYLAEEFEQLNKKQEELLIEQQIEKQRNEMRLIEMEKEEQERQAKRLKCVITCQKAFRYKRFKVFLNKLKQERLIKFTLIVQRKWRLIKFRKCLRILMKKRQDEIEYQEKLVNVTITCQKAFRMKLFRINFKKLKNKQNEHVKMLNQKASLIQRKWRLNKFRLKMQEYKKSAVTIQKWFRGFFKPEKSF